MRVGCFSITSTVRTVARNRRCAEGVFLAVIGLCHELSSLSDIQCDEHWVAVGARLEGLADGDTRREGDCLTRRVDFDLRARGDGTAGGDEQ
jgi:hypothetical protein